MTRPIHEYATELTALEQAINEVTGVNDDDSLEPAIASLEIFSDLSGTIIVTLYPDGDVEFDIAPDGEKSFDERFDAAVLDVLDYFAIN